MEKENKKFFELNKEERKERMSENWKKAKPIVKKVLFGLFCVIICLLMVFGVLRYIDRDNNHSDDHDHNHAQLVLEITNEAV